MDLRIKKAIYLSTRLSQVLVPQLARRRANIEPRKLVFYPPFSSSEKLADQVNRVRWYVPKQAGAEIWMAVEESLDRVDWAALPVPTHQRAPRAASSPNVRVCHSREINEKLQKADVICVWNTEWPGWIRTLLPYWLHVRIVDPEFFLFSETHTYPAMLWYDLLTAAARTAWTAESRRGLRKLFDEFGGTKRAYAFGTGPSIVEAENHAYADGIRIVCNSMVRNDRLLEHIQPQVLAFTDSVFHFGVSKYAEQFAQDAIKVVERYGCYCIINQVGYALMRVHYPELVGHLIGVPALRFGRPVALTPASFKTRDYANILTRYMLPLAVGISNEVVLMGFDGRNPDETYFWKHNPTTQYVDIMDSAKVTHPAFFRDIDYDAYYEKHCSVLKEILDGFEGEGKRITTWTKSFVPALGQRYREEKH